MSSCDFSSRLGKTGKTRPYRDASAEELSEQNPVSCLMDVFENDFKDSPLLRRSGHFLFSLNAADKSDFNNKKELDFWTSASFIISGQIMTSREQVFHLKK